MDPAKTPSPQLAAHWRRTRRLTALLLFLWFLVTSGVIFFARSLSEITLFGWNLSYYMAAQGALFVYMAIVGIYAWRMNRLEERITGENGDDQ